MIRNRKYFFISLITMLFVQWAMAQQWPLNKGIHILSPKFFPGWQAQNVSFPFVIYDTAHGLFRMYYAGSSSTQVNESLWDQWMTGYVTSRDGLNWRPPDDYEQILFAKKYYEGDVINPDEQSKIFDAVYAVDACVIKDGPSYKCWYTGWNGDVEHVSEGITRKKNFRIGFATSNDGIAWNKSGPVFEGEDPFVIMDNGQYRMWYVESGSIHYAVSTDAKNWTKKGRLPLGGDEVTRNPVVFKRAGQYELWYCRKNTIHRALSTDGITWNKANEVELHPEPPKGVGRYSPWTSISPDNSGELTPGNVVVLPDNSCLVFYAKKYTVSRDLTYGKRQAELSFIYTERVNP
jgi:hypothetical protein